MTLLLIQFSTIQNYICRFAAETKPLQPIFVAVARIHEKFSNMAHELDIASPRLPFEVLSQIITQFIDDCITSHRLHTEFFGEVPKLCAVSIHFFREVRRQIKRLLARYDDVLAGATNWRLIYTCKCRDPYVGRHQCRRCFRLRLEYMEKKMERFLRTGFISKESHIRMPSPRLPLEIITVILDHFVVRCVTQHTVDTDTVKDICQLYPVSRYFFREVYRLIKREMSNLDRNPASPLWMQRCPCSSSTWWITYNEIHETSRCCWQQLFLFEMGEIKERMDRCAKNIMLLQSIVEVDGKAVQS